MLLILTISMIILLITVSLHYHQHFKLHVSICAPEPPTLKTMKEIKGNSSPTMPRTPQSPQSPQSHRSRSSANFDTHHRSKGGCVCGCVFTALRPKDGEDKYDFFPTSFLYYLLFIIFLCALIIAIDIIDYYCRYHALRPDILFDYSIQSHHQFDVDKRSLSAFNSIYVANSEASEGTGWIEPFIKVSDYILIHSVMLLFLWESLFSFYKYYTTNVIVRRYEITSSQAIMVRFMMYGVPFAVIFMAQMHFYYYLWPLLFLLHSIFNLICTIMFSSMLIQKYRIFIEMDGGLQSSDDENILQSVYTMRTISVICSVLQSMYLALFTISYTVNTIYYLPILWSINSCIYSFTFIRNRKYLSFKCFQCKQRFKHKVSTVTTARRHSRTKTLSLLKEPQSNGREMDQVCVNTKFSVVNVKSFTIDTAVVHNSHERGSSTVSSTVSDADALDAGEIPLPQIQPKMRPNHVRHRKMTSVALNTKALKLLGIDVSSVRPPVVSKTTVRNKPSVPKKKMIVHSQSDIVISPTGSVGLHFDPPCSTPIIYSKTAPQTATTPITHGTIAGSQKNHALVSIDEMEIEEPIPAQRDVRYCESQTMSYVPQLPLRRISSPSVPREFLEKRLSMNPNITINIEDIEYIDDEDDEDDGTIVMCVDEEVYNAASVVDKGDEDDLNVIANHTDLEKKDNVPKTAWLCHPQLTHRKSSSDPVGINDSTNMNMYEVMESLDLFAKYGFCSRNSINSLYQLARYRNKGHIHQITFHQSTK